MAYRLLRSTATVAAFAAASCATLAAAQDADAVALDEGFVLDTLVVSGGGPAGEGSEARATVGADTLLGAYQGAGVEAVLNGIAGVTTETTAGDPAVAVNIRGLSGQGRVVVTIDGARQNFARSDHGANGTFYVDPEMLRSVEVVRGTTGADAAPGAIGGTVALRTVEAADLIDAGETQGGEARVRFGTLTAEPTLHGANARQFGAAASGLIAFTGADASDYEAGDGQEVEAADSQRSGLAKLAFSPVEGQTVTLGYSVLRSDFRTGVASGFPRDSELDTTNATLGYVAGPAEVTLYRTETRVSQRSLDGVFQPEGPWRSYDTATDGLRASTTHDLMVGPTDQTITFVAEAFRDTVRTDDPDASAIGGSLTPSGERTIASLLVEDTVRFGAETRAIVGLRYLDYRLESPDGHAADASLSPSLTVEHRILDVVSVYGTLAQATRPPTLSETLVNGVHPPPATFVILPNPDLEPESAFTTEIGATLAMADLIRPGDRLDARLAFYRNDVDDFIGLVQRGTLFDAYFQYDNIDAVRIEGAELEIGYDAGVAFASVSGQLMEGTDRRTGDPVSNIPPNRVVLTGGVRNGAETLEVGSRVSIVDSREDGTLSSDAWTTVDLFLTRSVGSRGSFGLALNNITDETYTPYLSTQPSPGFNALASLTIAF